MSQTNLQNSFCKIKLKTLNFSLFSKSTLKGDLILARKHIKFKKLDGALVTLKNLVQFNQKLCIKKKYSNPKNDHFWPFKGSQIQILKIFYLFYVAVIHNRISPVLQNQKLHFKMICFKAKQKKSQFWSILTLFGILIALSGPPRSLHLSLSEFFEIYY